MSKCDSCSHSEVCKHKEEFTNLEGKLPKAQLPFTSLIKCNQYIKNESNCGSNPYQRAQEICQRYMNEGYDPRIAQLFGKVNELEEKLANS